MKLAGAVPYHPLMLLLSKRSERCLEAIIDSPSKIIHTVRARVRDLSGDLGELLEFFYRNCDAVLGILVYG